MAVAVLIASLTVFAFACWSMPRRKRLIQLFRDWFPGDDEGTGRAS